MSSYISSPSMSESAHGASRSSSIPSSLLVIAGSIESHAVFTHCVTIGNDGLLGLTAAGCSTVSDIIHADHCSRSLHLKGGLQRRQAVEKLKSGPPG